MASFLKKALSVFVEFDETAEKEKDNKSSAVPTAAVNPTISYKDTPSSISKEDLDKFEKHFDSILDNANLPGPDYYEFIKTIDVLETHISDEKVRITAAYASLNAQGLSKEKLISSAQLYKSVIEKDKASFEAAANDKIRSDIEDRKTEQKNLTKKIQDDSEAIKKLTDEINQCQVKLNDLEKLIAESNSKIKSNMDNYQYACTAILNKISDDINKINTYI